MAVGKLITWTLVLAPFAACHGSNEGKAALPPKGETPAADEAQAKAGEAKAADAKPADAKPAAAQPADVKAADAASAASPAADATAQGASTAPSSEPGTKVKGAPNAAPAAPTAQSMDYRLTGQVSAIRHSALGFRISGFIKSVTVKPGNAAKAGEVLATIDDRDFVVRLELAQARRDTAKVQLAEADKEFKREQELQKENASTATTYDKVKSAADQAKLGLRLAELDLETAELAVKDTKLLAPYDCVVADQLKFDGESVQVTPPAPVLDVYDTQEPEIALSAPERLMGQIKVGSSIKVAVPSAGFSGKGEVTRIVPVISERTRTFQVIARFKNFDSKIVPGTYAEATIE